MNERVVKSTGDVIDIGWAKVFGSGLAFVLEQHLALVELRVLLHLIATMKAGSNAVVNARAAVLAETLGHDRSNVSRALRKLEEMHLIRRQVDHATRVSGAQVNPFVACKMDSDRRGRLIAEGGWHKPVGAPQEKPSCG